MYMLKLLLDARLGDMIMSVAPGLTRGLCQGCIHTSNRETLKSADSICSDMPVTGVHGGVQPGCFCVGPSATLRVS